MKHLIFDFDGVLADTQSVWFEVKKEVDGLTHEEIVQEFDSYFTRSTHTRDLALSTETLQTMRDWSRRAGAIVAQKEFSLFQDFIQEIKKIPSTKMAVVSSGSIQYIKPRLQNCGLTFTHILSFEDHHSKEEKVERICRDWQTPLDEVFFFTDAISDVVELEKILDRNKIYGCAWGYQGREKLLTVLDQDHVLVNFSDINRVFVSDVSLV